MIGSQVGSWDTSTFTPVHIYVSPRCSAVVFRIFYCCITNIRHKVILPNGPLHLACCWTGGGRGSCKMHLKNKYKWGLWLFPWWQRSGTQTTIQGLFQEILATIALLFQQMPLWVSWVGRDKWPYLMTLSYEIWFCRLEGCNGAAIIKECIGSNN